MVDRTRELLVELVKLRGAWETSVVEVRTGDLTTTLFLNFGEVAAVKASKPGEPIGRVMLRKQLISREHYVEVLERLGDVASTGERVAFGEVAVGLGYAKAEDVSACLTDQVRSLAMRVFQGEPPEWTVLPMPADRDPSRDLTMRIEAIFLEAIRMDDDARKGALGLDAARSLALRPAWDIQEIDVRFELTEAEAEFVRVALAGDKTVDQLLAAGAGDVDATSVLTALIASGAVESRAVVAAEQHSKPEPRKQPPPLPAWATVDATKAKDAAETAVRAKRSLAPPPKDGASSAERLLRAERTFEQGRTSFCRGETQAALTEFERALALNPKSVEYQIFARWSRHRLSGAKLVDPVRSELETAARDALRENPHIAIAHFVLAEVHAAAGRTEEAKTERSRARGLDRELFEIRETRTEPKAAAKIDTKSEARSGEKSGEKSREKSREKGAVAGKGQKATGSMMPVALVGGVVVIGVIAALFLLRKPAGTPVAPPVGASASAVPAVTASTAPVAGAGSAPVASAVPAVDAGATRHAGPGDAGAAGVAGTKTEHPVDGSHGVVRLPKSAEGHRLFVDGKTHGDASDAVVLTCGHHEVRIGSQGTPHGVDVPCGAEVDFR